MTVSLAFLRKIALSGAMVLVPAALAAQTPVPPVAPAPVAPAAPAPATVVQVPEGMKIGAVVQLASGGPKMTVIDIAGANVKTQWQDDKTGQLSSAEFPIAALKVVKADAADAEDDDEEDDDEEEDDKSKK